MFFLAVFTVYWLTPPRFRKYLLTIASYIFYGSWNYRFLGLLWLSTLTDYWCGRWMEDHPSRRKSFLVLSIVVNLGQLAIFKYMGFFIASANDLLSAIGLHTSIEVLHLVLPLGISFYTFQSLAYTIDVYRGKTRAERDFPTFAAFGSFFPQLIAGPIERASYLIPQLKSGKRFSEIDYHRALYLFAYGFFKKRVIADYLVIAVDRVFDDPQAHGASVMIGFLACMVRFYCDVSGYADMARGVALMLGIELSKNFDFPYFAKNPVEFWNRWHITLSHWVRYYLYNPLLVWLRRPIVCLFVAFAIMGAWHGASWHFVQWGLYWAFVSVIYQSVLKRHLLTRWPSLGAPAVAYVSMFIVILIGQSFFRADGVMQYFQMWVSAFRDLHALSFFDSEYSKALFCMVVISAYEFFLFRRRDELYVTRRNFYFQAAFYGVLFFLYRNIGRTAAVDFVYFQF